MKKSLALLPLLSLVTAVEAKTDRPNVLMIMADDMGFECLGANGSTYKSPNLDRLAENGIRFTNCHAQPLSTPTRVELMTGLYNNRNYVEFRYLDPSQRTFANMAQEQGYKTCIAGKWQLGDYNHLPAHFGFDNYCLWQLTDKESRYASPTYEVDGGAVIHDDIDVYGPDVYSDYICDFIDKNHDDPMFIYYPMALIHTPCTPTPDSEEWKDEKMRRKNIGKDRTWQMVEYADKIIGKLLKNLKDNDILDNTLILFVGDNGTTGEVLTPMKDGSIIEGGKGGTLRNGTHVPMIAYWNGTIDAGGVNENIVDVSDFYPTIRDAINGDKSKDRELDGISFYDQLMGKKSSPRKWSFCHYPKHHEPEQYVRFTQTADYKLYSSGRFYNTRIDTKELNNITCGTAKEEKIRRMLQKALDSYPQGSEIREGDTFDITE